MKNLLATILILLTAQTVFSQTCGSINGTSTPNTSTNNNQYWVKIYYHIVRRTDQTGGFSASQLCNITSRLNQDFNPYGIYFATTGTGFSYLNNDSFFDLTASSSTPFSVNAPSDAINIYLVNSYTPQNSGSLNIAGCANGIPSSAFWIVNNEIFNAISHEMGHCLGLYHTHRGTPLGPNPETDTNSCLENINSSNCSTCGDKICDTAASPNLLGFTNNCVYTNPTGWTQNGTPYNPDTRNIMSYSNNACLTQFSTQQVYAMKNRLIGSGLTLNSPFPTISGVSTVCNSSTYTVQNIASGYAVSTWTSSNTGVANINTTGLLTKVSNGLVTVRASISQGCASYFATKSVYVGTPNQLSGTYSFGTFTYPISIPSTGIGVSSSTPSIYFNLRQEDPNATTNWSTTSSGGSSSFSNNGLNSSLFLSGGAYRNLSCFSSNSCGVSPTVTFNCYNYSSGFRMSTFPNPASAELNVSAEEVLNEEDALSLIKNQQLLLTDDIKKIDLKLFDNKSKQVLSGKFSDKKIKFDTQKVPNGEYFLHIGEGEYKVIKRIIIQN
jgi:hypothetical protein